MNEYADLLIVGAGPAGMAAALAAAPSGDSEVRLSQSTRRCTSRSIDWA